MRLHTGGCTDTVRDSALKVDSGRKIPCCTEESNLPQRRAGPTIYQLSCIPAPSLRPRSPSFAFGTALMTVRLTMALSRPFKENCRALPLSMSLSSRRSMVSYPWLCAPRKCVKHLSTSDFLRSKTLVVAGLVN